MKTNSDTSHYLASSASRGKFVLSRRRNERGQVAIFVALIFQVVFVFFALLINVGLLVHHKINLQHSTDLAAYYGAMKQAEQMNAIAHINFQMRQAWKLLTWRYRIFGTFGFVENRDSPINGVAYPNTIQQFPFQQGSDGSPSRPFVFNGARGRVPTNINAPYVNGTDPMTCAAYGEPRLRVDGQFIGIQDIPFFCAGHDGISAWNPTENLCQLNCPMFLDARVIQAIPLVNNASTLMNSSLPGALNSSLNAANTVITNACTALGPVGVRLLTKFLLAYTAESTFRSETIKMLAQNLSQDVGQTVDLDGKRIIDGSERTFKNNLTGANFTGLDQSASFKAYNGLNSLKCRFVNGNSPNSYEFLRKVEFKLINYFVHSCEIDQSNAKRYAPASLYDTNGVNTVFTRPTGNPSVGPLGPDEVNFLLSLLDNRSLHNIGYEKNPNCVEYFAVKTFSEPNIPFLPLKKIRLEASAVAKPFGGSMGPAFGKRWDIGETNSGYNDADPNSKTDATMPIRGAPDNTVQDLKQSVYRQPNFALYVGDHLGLRNLDYIATYHSMLAKRDIQSYSGKTYTSARNLFNAIKPPPPNSWPAFNNWLNIGSITADARSYDSLATLEDSKAGTRAIEITAIAPNQFDVSYYSIDPDFYNNYYVKIFNNLQLSNRRPVTALI